MSSDVRGTIALFYRDTATFIKGMFASKQNDPIIGNADFSGNSVKVSAGPRFHAAMALAIIADIFQIAVFPLFVEGALSPADDVVDLGVGAAMIHLLGWHWEFLPSFFAKLVPGVDLVPFWTIAVANVYRKSKQVVLADVGNHPNTLR